MNTRTAMLSLAALLCACGGKDDPMGPAGDCTDDTGSVTVTISGAQLKPTFSWSPACAVALVLVEEDGGDVWGVSTDDSTWDDPEAANLIHSPVTYGTVPPSTTEFESPAPLVAGVTYDIVLWRIPPGSTADCLAVAFDACLLANQEFTP